MEKILNQRPFILFDGAMGTYFADRFGDSVTQCELANIHHPEYIRKIHTEYMEAGANAIKTNTFSANAVTFNGDYSLLEEVISKGYAIAKEVADTFGGLVFADIGPISYAEEVDLAAEYRRVADIFLSLGAQHFIFETFSEVEPIIEIAKIIKNREPEAFILAQFAVSPDGYTQKGNSGIKLIEEVKNSGIIDAYGVNCVSGPKHLYEYVKQIDLQKSNFSVMPNAGYPSVMNGRTVFRNDPVYFASVMVQIQKLGVKILGGCCGTTPQHIRETAKQLSHIIQIDSMKLPAQPKEQSEPLKKENNFYTKLLNHQKPIAVEMDPPVGIDISKVMEGSKRLKEEGVSLITIADCPLARARVDSSMIATKIMREAGIEAMPHIACRDRNINAIKALLLGLHIEHVRNVLAVTGDAISKADRSEIKGVFNLNAFMLASFIKDLNATVFAHDPMVVSAALNVNATYFDSELKRAEKKVQNGVEVFFTQPVYDEHAMKALERVKETLGVKIMGGVMPLVSYQNAMFMNNEVPGIHIPDDVVRAFEGKERAEAQSIGVRHAIQMAKDISNLVDGYYFIAPFNRYEMIIEIMKGYEAVQ